MQEIRKRLLKIDERINYLIQVKGSTTWGNVDSLQRRFGEVRDALFDLSREALLAKISGLEEELSFLEERAEESLTSMDRVRIVRSPLRFSLKDILENVYDDYTELGGEEEASIDPSMVCAKATISAQVKGKTVTQQVMVIGHEKGHGEEYRNGGSSKPWGNEKALRFMKVAQTEGIPIHSYIFTPGSFPIEEYPGAGQQIARNIYVMTKLRVPIISLISEGGSGGAEAIGLSDYRMMFSHGYYSVISPEGAAAIEGKIREGEKVPAEMVEACAERLKITAKDNRRLRTIDRIIDEPRLGGKRDDFAFFKRIKFEMIRATDEVVLKTKSLRAFRAYELKLKRSEEEFPEDPHIDVSWELTRDEIRRLLELRSKKYREMACHGLCQQSTLIGNLARRVRRKTSQYFYNIRYDLLQSHGKQVKQVMRDVSGESSAVIKQVTGPLSGVLDFFSRKKTARDLKGLISSQESDEQLYDDTYTSPLANEDRTVTCPNSERCGCKDLWVPDLYGEFGGVCETCGYHFPLEYEWYLKHLFDRDSIREFNDDIAAGNPLGASGFEKRLQDAIRKTGRRSSMITFDARVMGIEVVVAMLYSNFRNGTVGSAEGEKFAQAAERARMMHRPLLSYVHTTGGIRIQEGTLGVTQMPKCTMAVREYVDAGGLYIVVYDNNSYAGPVASFLGCSNYQFAIRSSRIGFAGPRVIRDTTGDDIPPDYHSARNALKRGHIHGIWDRREFRVNLYKSLMTMGGKSLYYR
ncbi:MAG: acetyl-CoA carboxylase carboxyl transferase subunit alpha/beta [Desulfobulbaceae bacterium]|nr:MAG: acetyl-CoA carboxylase carboxyl transferase subunit alpha/beta [Desulfobulbaceae bacterium]